MPNALNGGMPPPPQQETTPQGNGMMPAGQAPGGPQQQPATPSPPTHEQTVAALRHFDAIKGAIAPLLADPALGKSDMKSKIIDGVTKLVAERIISAGTAVDQLSKVPADPLEQRKTLQAMMQQAQQAENNILDHYGHGNPSLGEVHEHFGGRGGGSPDDHMEHIKALHANYSGAK